MFTIIPYVLAYITRETTIQGAKRTEILFIKRSLHLSFGGGLYALVGGKVEENESMRQATVREAFEEVGIHIELHDASLSHIIYFQGETRPCIAAAFTILSWQGEPFNKEPEKHDHVAWFDSNDLPTNIVPRHAKIIGHIKHGTLYCDEGFGSS